MKLLSYILTILSVFCGTDCYARPVTGNIEGHDYVDLGLPSGLKWATCNVGATSPEECGDSFAWGEVKTKKDFTKDSSFTTFQSAGRLQKRGVIDSYGVLTAMCDAATQNWGDKWRMPTKEEFDELVEYCSWTWIVWEQGCGYLIESKKEGNDNWIFLPASYVFKEFSQEDFKPTVGEYWSSTVFENDDWLSYRLSFHSLGSCNSNKLRYLESKVRPVLK